MAENIAEIAGDDWRKPYRSRDASGAPDTAGAVGWRWIEERAQEAKAVYSDHAALRIETDSGTIALYRSTELLAAATIFRDQMNFAVLIRWVASC